MSLINDALKKAQKQRTGEVPPLASMPSVGGESPQRIASRGKPAGSETMIMRAGIGGAVVLVLAVGGFFLLRDKPEDGGPASLRAGSESEASAKSGPQGRGPSSEPAPVQSPATPGPSPITSSPASAAPAPSFTLPVAPKSDDGRQTSDVSNVGGALHPDNPPTTVAKSEPPKQASLPKAVAAQPAAPAPVPAAERPKLEARAIEFIENIKVAGIRASATDAKVLMNDRVYRPGSMVSAEFGLKLLEITASSLTFEDDRGGRYTRTF